MRAIVRGVYGCDASPRGRDSVDAVSLGLALLRGGSFIHPMLTKIYVSLAHEPADIHRHTSALAEEVLALTAARVR